MSERTISGGLLELLYIVNSPGQVLDNVSDYVKNAIEAGCEGDDGYLKLDYIESLKSLVKSHQWREGLEVFRELCFDDEGNFRMPRERPPDPDLVSDAVVA